MGIFSKIFNGSTEDGNQVTLDMQNGLTSGVVKEAVSDITDTSSGSTSITEETAMKIASLYQGVNIIADTIASMPVYLYNEKDGFQQVNTMDARSRALSDMSNDVLTAYNLKKNLVKDLILYGNAYAKIVRDGDNITLHYLPTTVVTPKRDTNGYYFSVQGYSTGVMGEMLPSELVDYYDMLTLIRNPQYNSVIGQGLLDHASSIFEMSIQETNYMTNLFKNGLSAKAVLTSKTPFKKEVKEQLKRDISNMYSGASNSGKMMVLEGDISVVPLSLTPTDIKLIENKHFTISEISRFLNIPKHMLSLDRQQGTYSNITQERLQLLQNTLTPYVVAIEGALNQKLLTEEEIEQGYYFQFNTAEMLKLTPEDNASYMLKLYEQNIVTLEEVRATLNLGGDEETIAQLKKVDAMKDIQLENELTGEESNLSDEEAKEEVTDTKVDTSVTTLADDNEETPNLEEEDSKPKKSAKKSAKKDEESLNK